MNRSLWAKLGVVALTLGGLITLYQIAFDVWMTAYPYCQRERVANSALHSAGDRPSHRRVLGSPHRLAAQAASVSDRKPEGPFESG